MGWWSTDVLGGDDPLDVLCDIAEELDLQDSRTEGRIGLYPLAAWDDDFRSLVRERVTERMSKITAVADNHERSEFRAGIGYQVLAVVIMACGADLPENIRDKARAAAMTDQLADQHPGRAAAMRSLLEQITRYDGNPSVAGHKTLTEAAQDGFEDDVQHAGGSLKRS